MKYELPQISEDQFTDFHSFVQSCFDLGRQQFDPKLTRITTVNKGFNPLHAEYLRKSDALAVTMENHGDYQKRFQIWVNPCYKEPSFGFYMTLAHELVHGYAGLKYGHNAHWRRWLYRVMWHLDRSSMIPEAVDGLELVCFNTGLRYNYTNHKAELDLIEEAFRVAEQEHDKVEENFWKRTIDAPSRNLV